MAADAGNTEFYKTIAWMYYNGGFGVEKNVPKAVEYWTIVAEDETVSPNSSGDSMLWLGDIYANGEPGVKADYRKAMSWYNKALNSTGEGIYSKADSKIKALDKEKLACRSIPGRGGSLFWDKNAAGQRQLVDEDGKVIVPGGKFDSIKGYDPSYIIIKKDGKVGAYNYNGKQIVAPVYKEYIGSGKQGKLLFSNPTTNGNKFFAFTKEGKLLASRVFSNSQTMACARWIKDLFVAFSIANF